MLVRTKPCPRCGEVTVLSIDEDKFARWQGGDLIQNVFPEMTPARREQLISGYHPSCWTADMSEMEGEF